MFEIKFYTYDKCHTKITCDFKHAIKLLAEYRNCGLGYLWQHLYTKGEYAIVNHLEFD